MDSPEVLLAVIDVLSMGVTVVDQSGKIVLWNRQAERLTGFLRQEVIGRSVREGFLGGVDMDNNDLSGDAAPAVTAMRDGKQISLEASLRHRSGHRIPTRLRVSTLRDERGTIIGAVESFEETIAVSDWERRQSKLAAYGCLDRTSGVLNHGMMQSHLRELLSTFAEHPVPFAVLCVALDQMETIKKRHGPGALAALVRTVGQTLELSLRPTDSVGRWQENEFLAILQECTSEEARKTAERLRKMAAMAKIEWWGDVLPITLSIGATEARKGDTLDGVLGRAEAQLQESRDQGGDRVGIDKE
ncbi:MAG: diguanylate cyclase [Candidatus Acidiferrum sp.]|jgi:diguanylate cyclase (GGDEF)-like protein/PAS domain S-box-containing protein